MEQQLPEPLNYLTALSSMKAIRKILNDQKGFDKMFFMIHVESPFDLLDFFSFEKSLSQAGTKQPGIVKRLKEILIWAEGNLKIYSEIEAKHLTGRNKVYYQVENNGDIYPINTERGIQSFGSKYKPKIYSFVYEMYEFCKSIQDSILFSLENPMEPCLPISISSPQPLSPKPTQTELTIAHRISQYLSFKLKGEQPESPYQLVSKTQETLVADDQMKQVLQNELADRDLSKMNVTSTVMLDSELEADFVSFITKPELSTCIDYLEFHLSRYLEANPGNEIDFFGFILDRINGTFIFDGKPMVIPKSRVEAITAWINETSKPAIQGNTGPQTKPARAKKVNPPALQFVDYLHTVDNQKSLEFLKGQFSGKKGQTIAYMIIALKKIRALEIINKKALCEAISADLGGIGTYESIRKIKEPDQQKNQKQYKRYLEIYSIIAINIHVPTY